jgi:hypothetical protein
MSRTVRMLRAREDRLAATGPDTRASRRRSIHRRRAHECRGSTRAIESGCDRRGSWIRFRRRKRRDKLPPAAAKNHDDGARRAGLPPARAHPSSRSASIERCGSSHGRARLAILFERPSLVRRSCLTTEEERQEHQHEQGQETDRDDVGSGVNNVVARHGGPFPTGAPTCRGNRVRGVLQGDPAVMSSAVGVDAPRLQA